MPSQEEPLRISSKNLMAIFAKSAAFHRSIDGNIALFRGIMSFIFDVNQQKKERFYLKLD